ncbi:MAG: EamA family transporter [Microbacteriaceae bacterium]
MFVVHQFAIQLPPVIDATSVELMLVVFIGVASALVFGAADFFGGMASTRIPAIRATALAAVVGLGTLLLAYPLVGGEFSREALLLGALSGVTGAVAISLLYACLAIGPMSILSPLTAVVSALVPVSVGLAQGEQLRETGYIALAIALIAVVLVGFVPERGAVRPRLAGVLMAVGSGIAIGLFLVIIDQTPSDSGLVPLIANRVVNAAIMFAVIAFVGLLAWRRRQRGIGFPTPRIGWRAGLTFAIVCGVLDAVANAGLLLGLRLGELSVMGVLTALYPAGTIILAAIVLKERIAPVQVVGLALAIMAGGLLAL